MEHEKIKVLVIEDSPVDQQLIIEMLSGERDGPFSVECAERLSEGLKKLEESYFDAVMLDLGLPDSFGLGTFTTVRSQAARVPIVVLSSRDDEELSLQAVHNGAQDYLVKWNVNAETIRRSLRYAIERKQIQEALWIEDRIIESSVNAVAITDMAGCVTYVNHAFLELWKCGDHEKTIGKSIDEFWDKPSEISAIKKAVVTSGRWLGKTTGGKGDGGELNLQLSAFIVKQPDDTDEPLCIVFSFVDNTELTRLRRRLKTEQSFAGIVGRDPKMLELFDTIRDVANSRVPVLLQGQSGTGKELVAAAIHNEGTHSDMPFVAVNCGALPEGVLESELFGHVKGAFTGAVHDRKGRFELADRGTIFLDEIGELPATVQVKLLRVLQEGTFQRVGGEETIKVDVRIISATNKNLMEEVAAGRFREDLFYRLCVVPVYLPPLCQRRTDIPLLAEHLLKKALAEAGRNDVTLSSEAIDMLVDYDWPGNVRELENALRYALIKCRENVLLPEHFPANVVSTDAPSPPPTTRRRRRKLNAELVHRVLAETGANKVEAARRLGVSRATLYRFLEELEQTERPALTDATGSG